LPGSSDLRHRYASAGFLVIEPQKGAGKTGTANLAGNRTGQTLHHRADLVLEEIHRLVEMKLVNLEVPFRRWAEELERSPNFQVQAYTLEVLLESVSLGAIRDPADRAIVATARHLRCPLITADGIIQDGDWVDTVWE